MAQSVIDAGMQLVFSPADVQSELLGASPALAKALDIPHDILLRAQRELEHATPTSRVLPTLPRFASTTASTKRAKHDAREGARAEDGARARKRARQAPRRRASSTGQGKGQGKGKAKAKAKGAADGAGWAPTWSKTSVDAHDTSASWGGVRVHTGKHGLLRWPFMQNIVADADATLHAANKRKHIPSAPTRAGRKTDALVPSVQGPSFLWGKCDLRGFHAPAIRVQPGTTLTLFPTNHCVVSGSKSFASMNAGISVLMHLLNELHIGNFRIHNLQITNIVATGYLTSDQRLDLDAINAFVPHISTFHTGFPGLFVYFTELATTLILFKTGSIVALTRSLRNVEAAFQNMEDLLLKSHVLVQSSEPV